MSYGKHEYYSEIEKAQINLYNHKKQTEEKRHINEIRAELEDRRIAESCGISVEELNQNRRVG